MNFKDLSQVQLRVWQKFLGAPPVPYDYTLQEPYPKPSIETESITELNNISIQRNVLLAFDKRDAQGKMTEEDGFYNADIALRVKAHPTKAGKKVVVYQVDVGCGKAAASHHKKAPDCTADKQPLTSWIVRRFQSHPKEAQAAIRSLSPEYNDTVIASMEEYAAGKIPEESYIVPFVLGLILLLIPLGFSFRAWRRTEKTDFIGTKVSKGGIHVSPVPNSREVILERHVQVKFIQGKHYARHYQDRIGATTDRIRGKDVITLDTKNYKELKMGDILSLSGQVFLEYNGTEKELNKAFTLLMDRPSVPTSLKKWKERLEAERSDLLTVVKFLGSKTPQVVRRALRVIEIEHQTAVSRELKKSAPWSLTKSHLSRDKIEDVLESVRLVLPKYQEFEARQKQFKVDDAKYLEDLNAYRKKFRSVPESDPKRIEEKAKLLAELNRLDEEKKAIAAAKKQLQKEPISFRKEPPTQIIHLPVPPPPPPKKKVTIDGFDYTDEECLANIKQLEANKKTLSAKPENERTETEKQMLDDCNQRLQKFEEGLATLKGIQLGATATS